MKRILIAFLLIFTLTGCADLVLPPQTPVSFSAACRDAATVVLAEVTAIGEAVGAEVNITTPVTLKLVECYSRDHDPYDEITVHLAAGTVDGFTLSCGFTLKVGEAYFLFLNDIGVITGGAHLPDFVADSDPWEQEFEPLAADEIYAEFENLGALEWEANLWSDKTAHAKRYIFSDFQYEYDRHAYVFLAAAVREDPPYIADGNTIDPDKSWRENWQGIVNITTQVSLEIDEVIKGDMADSVVIAQERGTVNGYTLRSIVPHLKPGEQYLILMTSDGIISPYSMVKVRADGTFKAYADYGMYDDFERIGEIKNMYYSLN